MENGLPYLDVSAYGLDISDAKAKVLRDNKDDSLKIMAYNMMDAIEKHSFCVLLNTGIDRPKLLEAFDAVCKFVDQPLEQKEKYAWNLTSLYGYLMPFTEQLGSAPKTDLNPTYAFMVDPRQDGLEWPDHLSPKLRPAIQSIVGGHHELLMRMNDILSIGLHLKDVEYLRKNTDFGPDYFCPWRFNCYRPLKQDEVLKPGEMRFGDHTDEGTFTLVFPQFGSGLQIRLEDGTWKDIPYTPGMIVMVAGDTLAYMTCGRIKALTHRVKVPDGPERYQRRCSLAHFSYPNKHVIIAPVDGSVNEKYPPVEAHTISLASYYSRHREEEYTVA